jgi:parallel beta-helix repeat protein
MKALILALLAAAAPIAARTVTVAPAPDAQDRLQTALIEAQPGDTVQLAAGRYELTDGLSLDIASVTVRGAGPDKTVLSFKGQKGAGEGLLVTSADVVLRDFAVEDTRGDGIKSKGADRIVYHNIRVEWTGGPNEKNGAYGVYPVSSTDVLIDRVTVRGASDAGIYVGQSRNIVVRHSTAEMNVAGIEIENSYNADVHHNTARKNAGGILVFDLPNLPQMGGHSIRVFENQVVDNDTPNFAPKGNIVASVPTGTGVMVMANAQVHVFDNTLANNGNTNVMLIGYRRPFEDKSYNPLIRDVVVRDNKHGRAGFAPTFAGGKELAAAMGGALAPVFWDGTGTGVVVRESVAVMSLNLPSPAAPVDQARPAPATFPAGPLPPEPKPVVLPASMEAAIK